MRCKVNHRLLCFLEPVRLERYGATSLFSSVFLEDQTLLSQTAVLREVLSDPKYHVLHFDLRIAGFADLGSLYNSLSMQMEQYFEEISKTMPGYESFEREGWSFKVYLFLLDFPS